MPIRQTLFVLRRSLAGFGVSQTHVCLVAWCFANARVPGCLGCVRIVGCARFARLSALNESAYQMRAVECRVARLSSIDSGLGFRGDRRQATLPVDVSWDTEWLSRAF